MLKGFCGALHIQTHAETQNRVAACRWRQALCASRCSGESMCVLAQRKHAHSCVYDCMHSNCSLLAKMAHSAPSNYHKACTNGVLAASSSQFGFSALAAQ